MGILCAVRQSALSRREFAITCFVVTTATLFVMIWFGQKIFLATDRVVAGNSHNKQIQNLVGDDNRIAAPSTLQASLNQRPSQDNESGPISEGPEETAQPSNDVQRKAVLQKLETDGRHLDQLRERRNHFYPESANTEEGLTREAQDSHSNSDDNDMRGQLAVALIHLLDLEKHESGDSPEIFTVRQQITNLQKQLAIHPVVPQAVRVAHDAVGHSHMGGLDKVNMQISICQNQMIDDIERLSQLAPAPKHTLVRQEPEGLKDGPLTEDRTQQRASNDGFAADTIVATPKKRYSNLSLAIFEIILSVLLGLGFSAYSTVLWERLNGAIRNEADIRKLLPATVIFVGTIPRMKVS